MNPFIKLYDAPVETLTAAAYVAVLLGLLMLTWWALGRNLLFLRDQYQEGWKYLIPFWYTVRVAGVAGIVAVDLTLIGAIIYVL